MAIVNGYTAEHMQGILDDTIASASLINYELILTKYDNTTVNLGNVRGATGPTGATGATGPAGANGTGLIVCTSTTRPASPSVGQNIYETNTGKHLIYYGATTGWQPPWNNPWGVLTFVSRNGNDALLTSSTELNSAYRSTVSTVANRRLKFTIHLALTSASGGGLIDLYNFTTSATIGRLVQINKLVNTGDVTISANLIAASAATSTVYTLRGNTSDANPTTVVGSTVPTQFTIEDIGPTSSTPPAS